MATAIKLDTQRLATDLQKHLVGVLTEIRKEFADQARSHFNRPEAKDDLDEGDVQVVAGVITTEVIGGAWVAMDNYGRGSKMDTRNPALAEYRASDLWNPARHDLKIRSRPPGKYRTIFGEMRHTRGTPGRDLEKRGVVGFAPWPPSHALETAARWMKQRRVQELVQEGVRTFPWSRYIVVQART